MSTPTVPPPEPATFDRLADAFAKRGPDAVFDALVADCQARGDYHRLFEAMTLRGRFELGLPLIQTGPADNLPADQRAAYEDRVIDACRVVGQRFLDANNIPMGYRYLSMIGELDPVRRALERYQPGDDDATAHVMEVALAQGVHPERGVELILAQYGMCQAITACEQVLGQNPSDEVRNACICRVVSALHRELLDRLGADIARREGKAPQAASVTLLLSGRDWLFADDNYHIDTSHLNAVVRFARLLPKCPEVFLAMQLCEYGARLSERYRHAESPPFENVYVDSLIYLKAIAGIEVDAGLGHFRAKADAGDPNSDPAPAETFLNLLVKAGKLDDAVAYAERTLNESRNQAGVRDLLNQLCLQANAPDRLAHCARRRQDLLSFAAGLLMESKG